MGSRVEKRRVMMRRWREGSLAGVELVAAAAAAAAAVSWATGGLDGRGGGGL